MNYGKQLDEIRDKSNIGLYQNFKYQTERINKKIIILDSAYCNALSDSKDDIIIGSKIENGSEIKNNIGRLDNSYKNFNTTLTEKLNIDKDCEIYVNSIQLYGINTQNPIYLEFSQFKKEIYTNDSNMSNKYIIQKENQTDNSARNKKNNYLTTINSKEISDIDFSLVTEEIASNATNDGNDITYQGIFEHNTKSRIIIELLFVIKD